MGDQIYSQGIWKTGDSKEIKSLISNERGSLKKYGEILSDDLLDYFLAAGRYEWTAG